MMADITMCSPTKLTKKCQDCYRMTAKPDKWQSYANLSNPCQFLREISMEEYTKRMDKIISKRGKVSDILIALLDEANRVTIASDGQKKGQKCGQKVSKATKRVRK